MGSNFQIWYFLLLPSVTGSLISSYVPFLFNGVLQNQNSQEFLGIWQSSIPTEQQLLVDPTYKVSYEFSISLELKKLSLRTWGPVPLFVPTLSDFFWSVGTQDTEITEWKDEIARLEPPQIGSWIEVSSGGGVDGGWLFPGAYPCKDALKKYSELTTGPAPLVLAWFEENTITHSLFLGSDMGTSPPRPTEIMIPLTGKKWKNQLKQARSAYEKFSLPFPPEPVLKLFKGSVGLALSVWFVNDKFVRIGLFIPKPPTEIIQKLCEVQGVASTFYTDHLQLQQALDMTEIQWVELQSLQPGFGYGVYDEGFTVIFHYALGTEPSPPPSTPILKLSDIVK